MASSTQPVAQPFCLGSATRRPPWSEGDGYRIASPVACTPPVLTMAFPSAKVSAFIRFGMDFTG
jgi:hypothetical protein